MSSGFSELKPQGRYLISDYGNRDDGNPHIGQIRISFEYDKCGPCTVVAQQVASKQNDFSLRRWNPNMISPTQMTMTVQSDNS